MTEATHTGLCFCGAIRFEFSGKPLFSRVATATTAAATRARRWQPSSA
jgi:hypothetical protein